MSEASPESKPPPEVADHELIRMIGRGSYGEVWLARNVLGEFRAVKIIRRDRFQNDRPAEREFEGIQKYEPLSRVREHQVHILHVGRFAAGFYYVMELADAMAGAQEPSPNGSGRGSGIAPAAPPTPPDVRFSASGG